MKIVITGIQAKHVLAAFAGIALIVGVIVIGTWPDLNLASFLKDCLK